MVRFVQIVVGSVYQLDTLLQIAGENGFTAVVAHHTISAEAFDAIPLQISSFIFVKRSNG